MNDAVVIKPFALVSGGGWFFRTMYTEDGARNDYWIKCVDGIKSVNVFTGEVKEFCATDIVGEINDKRVIFA